MQVITIEEEELDESGESNCSAEDCDLFDVEYIDQLDTDELEQLIEDFKAATSTLTFQGKDVNVTMEDLGRSDG